MKNDVRLGGGPVRMGVLGTTATGRQFLRKVYGKKGY